MMKTFHFLKEENIQPGPTKETVQLMTLTLNLMMPLLVLLKWRPSMKSRPGT